MLFSLALGLINLALSLESLLDGILLPCLLLGLDVSKPLDFCFLQLLFAFVNLTLLLGQNLLSHLLMFLMLLGAIHLALLGLLAPLNFQ